MKIRRCVELLLLTPDVDNAETVLAALTLLAHTVRTARPNADWASEVATAAVLIVDALTDLARARSLCQLLAAPSTAPVVAVVAELGLVAISPAWCVDDVLLPTTGPAELDAWLRLVVGRKGHRVGGPYQTIAITLRPPIFDSDGTQRWVQGDAASASRQLETALIIDVTSAVLGSAVAGISNTQAAPIDPLITLGYFRPAISDVVAVRSCATLFPTVGLQLRAPIGRSFVITLDLVRYRSQKGGPERAFT